MWKRGGGRGPAGRAAPRTQTSSAADAGGGGPGKEGDEVFSAYVGELNNEQKFELDFLRSCAFATKLDGKPLTRAVMLEALMALAARAEMDLERHPQARTVYAAEPSANDLYWTHRLFSRGVGLSLPASGVAVKCLLMDDRHVPILSGNEVDLILGFVSSLIDLTVSKCGDQPAMKGARWRLERKQASVERIRRP